MTEETRTRQRLQYMAESMTRIAEYTGGNEETFLSQAIVQDAVLRRLETLADAAHHLPDEIRQRHPAVPWRQVYAFRNIAAHAYEFVAVDRVWEIIRDHLPVLARAVAEELARAPASAPSTPQD